MYARCAGPRGGWLLTHTQVSHDRSASRYLRSQAKQTIVFQCNLELYQLDMPRWEHASRSQWPRAIYAKLGREADGGRRRGVVVGLLSAILLILRQTMFLSMRMATQRKTACLAPHARGAFSAIGA